MERDSGTHLGHTFCNDCGSSDGLSGFKKSDGWIDGHCWPCEAKGFKPYKGKLSEAQLEDLGELGYTYPKGSGKSLRRAKESLEVYEYFEEDEDLEIEEEDIELTNVWNLSVEDVNGFPTKGWKDRRIPKSIYKLFGVKASVDDTGAVDGYYYPTYRKNSLVGYKPRTKYPEDHQQVVKGKVEAGAFKCFDGKIGDNAKGVKLFGQNLHQTAPKRVIICGGQENVMSYHKAIATKKFTPLGEVVPGYAVVGPQNGENDKDIKANLEWFRTAEEIYLCFDNDEAGRKCTDNVARLFPPKKIKLISITENDPSDMVVNDKEEELWFSIWSATSYCPAGISDWDSAFEAMRERGGWELIPFPESFGDLNAMTLGGHGLGEITNLVAKTSVGKSSLVNESIYTCIKETDYKVGIISLEADKVEFAEQMDSLELNYRLVEVPDKDRDWEEIAEAHKVFRDRIFVIEDAGTISGEDMFKSKVDFLVHGLGCQMIVVDPATTVVLAARLDEREYLADLIPYVKKNRISWWNICHTRKSDGETTENDTLGSGDWIRNAMITITADRDKVHENAVIKNTTKLTAHKIRRNGKATGLAGYTYYNPTNGRLELGDSPEDILESYEENVEDDFDKPINSFE